VLWVKEHTLNFFSFVVFTLGFAFGGASIDLVFKNWIMMCGFFDLIKNAIEKCNLVVFFKC